MKMPPPESPNSRLLMEEENNSVLRLLGNRCESLCTTVAQLYNTEPPNHDKWVKNDVGVLCFVKDRTRKNYFFRMFCLRRNCMIWEHPMFNNLEYQESTEFLHIFEGQDVIFSFNFAQVDEAKAFKRVVDEKFALRRKKQEQRPKQVRAQPVQNTTQINNFNNSEVRVNKKSRVSQSDKRKRNITKADIGSPLDFKHITHIGWNAHSGFDVDCQDEQLKHFFQKAGISEKQLQDQETKEFIYDFINTHGGREAVEESTNRHSVTSRKAPNIPISPQPPPPVPPRGPTRPTHRAAPPPPPETRAPISNNYNGREKAAAPPPPPPPMMEYNAPCPPPLPQDDLPPIPVTHNDESFNAPSNNAQSALLDSIRTGITLKPVEKQSAPAAESGDSRGQLLKQIQQGMKLKPVAEREVKPITNVETKQEVDLADALKRALAERCRPMHSEDDSDDEDSNDDEWIE